jgi:hypothetical protein
MKQAAITAYCFLEVLAKTRIVQICNSFSLPLCKAVTLATLYQCALHFLLTDYEQSKYLSSSSGFFLIKYQCHEFCLQSLYLTTLWIVFVCISGTTNHTKKYDLHRPPGIVRKVKSRTLGCDKTRKIRISHRTLFRKHFGRSRRLTTGLTELAQDCIKWQNVATAVLNHQILLSDY